MSEKGEKESHRKERTRTRKQLLAQSKNIRVCTFAPLLKLVNIESRIDLSNPKTPQIP